MDTIFLDRERKRDGVNANRRIEAALAAGEGVIIFPEGTSSDGDGVLPLMPSLLSVPAARGEPVWYASISYRTPPGEVSASRAVAWWGDDAFLPHLLALLRLPRFEAHLRIGPAPITGRDRKELAHRLHTAISAQRGNVHETLDAA